MTLRLFLLLSVLVIISSCTENSRPKTDFDRYCDFVTEIVTNEKYKKEPIEHLKKYSAFRQVGVSKALSHILVVIQKVEKKNRAEVFQKAANKVMKVNDWKCDAYAKYVENFTPDFVAPAIPAPQASPVQKPEAKASGAEKKATKSTKKK